MPGIPRHASHAIEGSLRLEGPQTRVVARLLDSAPTSIVWPRQFDICEPWSIALQAHLASEICAGLRQHVDGAGQLPHRGRL